MDDSMYTMERRRTTRCAMSACSTAESIPDSPSKGRAATGVACALRIPPSHLDAATRGASQCVHTSIDDSDGLA